MIHATSLALFAALVTGVSAPGSPLPPTPLLPSTPSLIVSPLRVSLQPGVRTGSVELRNPGTARKRFEVAAVAWRQGRDGQPQTSPTRDVFFHPALLDIPPGGKAIVRAGVAAGPTDVERTYRLVITELEPPPSPAGSPPGVALTMLTQLSIPIFVQPKDARATPALETLRVEKGRLAFRLVNRGNLHFTAKRLTVRGLDRSGATLFERARDGWYVLPGDPRDYDLDLPEGSCSALRAIEVTVESDAAPASARLDLPGGCPA